MGEIKLAPCPFCGGRAIFESADAQSAAANVRIRFLIRCQKCKAALPGVYHTELAIRQNGEIIPVHDDRKKAADMWNMRYHGNAEDDEEETV